MESFSIPLATNEYLIRPAAVQGISCIQMAKKTFIYEPFCYGMPTAIPVYRIAIGSGRLLVQPK